MTKREALAEARRRWGKYAWVRYERGGWRYADCPWYQVGEIDTVLVVKGESNTWEAAFADADRRKKEVKGNGG